jgi:hypothetical protein
VLTHVCNHRRLRQRDHEFKGYPVGEKKKRKETEKVWMLRSILFIKIHNIIPSTPQKLVL